MNQFSTLHATDIRENIFTVFFLLLSFLHTFYPPFSCVLAMQLSTLGQPRVLLVREFHHLAIVRDIISPALPRSSSVSVFVNTTVQGKCKKNVCSISACVLFHMSPQLYY